MVESNYKYIARGRLWGLFGGDKLCTFRNWETWTSLRGRSIKTSYCRLYQSGRLVLYGGFEWDGASGPTIDTAKTIRASAFHDCLAKLVEDGRLEYSWRINLELYRIMMEDGCSLTRATSWLIATNVFCKYWIG